MRLALAGDTMLGRGVAERLAETPPQPLFAPEEVEVVREADLFVLNLECCISARGAPWPDPEKPFYFRAPPSATEALVRLGVDCVTLANNHALDFGREALLDTVEHLDAAGIAHVGAGPDVTTARSPAVLESDGFRLAVVGAADHPEDFAADADRPGIAFAELGESEPAWLTGAISSARSEAGPVLFDLGDFIDDYAVDPHLRNDLGLLFIVDVDAAGPRRLEGVPLRLDFCSTRLAEGDDRDWILRRFREACAAFGTEVTERGGRAIVEWPVS